MFIKDLDFIVPYGVICDVTIRNRDGEVISTQKRPFIHLSLMYRECYIISFFPSDDKLIIDCSDIKQSVNPPVDNI